MIHIKPVSELRNNFSEISKIVHETDEPVFLTKNGYGDMVVMSLETYEKKLKKNRIDSMLSEAAQEAAETDVRYGHKDVMSGLRDKLKDR